MKILEEKAFFDLSNFQKAPVEHFPSNVPHKIIVSVCVQTYQHEKYIKECLDGVLMQKTNFDFEILIGEDCSSDRTRQICIDYAKKYSKKIRLFLHDRQNVVFINGKPSGRFNMLYNLKNTKGKYIALCEGDDYWTDPLKLQKQVDFLEANQEYMASCHNVIKKNEINQTESIKGAMAERDINISDLALKNDIVTLSLLFRNDSEVLDKVNNFFNNYNSPVGDYVINLFLAEKGKIKYSPEIMGVHIIHPGGVFSSNFNSSKKFINTYVSISDFIEKIKTNLPYDKVNENFNIQQQGYLNDLLSLRVKYTKNAEYKSLKKIGKNILYKKYFRTKISFKLKFSLFFSVLFSRVYVFINR